MDPVPTSKRPESRWPPWLALPLDTGRSPSRRQLAWTVFCYLAIAGTICFFGLASSDVVTMEGIVADGARYMDRTHGYSVPHLHGEIYSYKPPLAYWMALASFELFGEESEWTLRFPFAASGLIMGLAVLLLTSPVAGARTGLLCAFASLTGALTVQKLHLAEFDTPLAAGVGIAAAVASRNLSADRPHGGLWLIGYLALALAFLAKGVPALMFYAPGLLLAALWSRRLRALLKPAHLAGVVLFLAVIALWLASAYLAAGWEAFGQPFSEAQDKGLTWTASSIAWTLAKPVKAWVLFLPWTLLVPLSFGANWSSEPSRRMALAAAAFVAAGVVVYMLVPASESRYLLPLAAPVGILCGLAAEHVLGRGGVWRHRAILILAGIVGLAAVGAALLATSADTASRLLLATVAIPTLITLGNALRRRSPASGVWLLAAVATLAWLAHVRGVEPHRASSRSLRAVAADFEAHLSPGEEIWTGPVSAGFHHSSLFFYLRRPVRTFSPESGGPEPGDHVVFFSDEHADLMARAPFAFEVVERRSQRRIDFLLARVRASS